MGILLRTKLPRRQEIRISGIPVWLFFYFRSLEEFYHGGTESTKGTEILYYFSVILSALHASVVKNKSKHYYVFKTK